MVSRVLSLFRRLLVWCCAVLVVAVAVLGVRSRWRCDEVGFYGYAPALPPSDGRDRRTLIGSFGGGIYWLRCETDVERVHGKYEPRDAVEEPDWYGGPPSEVIFRSSAKTQLATAALRILGVKDFQPLPRWNRGGFHFKAGSGTTPSDSGYPPRLLVRWWYQGVVVPHWALCLVLALPAALGAARALRRRWILRRRRKHGLCPHCGYDVRASGEVCSECGQRWRETKNAEPPPHRSRRRVRWAAGALLMAGTLAGGAAMFGGFLHRPNQPAPPFLRLEPTTPLPADHPPPRIELDLGGGVSLRLVLIPAGRFLMGSPQDEADRDKNERQHEVSLSRPFYMGITEVTQEQYQAVTGTNPSNFQGAKHPVETVRWFDATRFCHQLSQRSGHTVRLPTEAEWEYACRAGTTTPFHTGRTLTRDMAHYYMPDTFPSNRTGEVTPGTLPVASFEPNAWGLYDMHGNVYEWCSDWRGPYPDDPVLDPKHPNENQLRARRGGSWVSKPRQCRTADRGRGWGAHWDSFNGFRIVLELR